MNTEKILLVVNSDCTNPIDVAIKADLVTKDQDADIYILCVVPDIPAEYYQIPSLPEFCDQQESQGNKILRQLGHQLNVTQDHCFLLKGRIKSETKHLADNLHIAKVITEDTPWQSLSKCCKSWAAQNAAPFIN